MNHPPATANPPLHADEAGEEYNQDDPDKSPPDPHDNEDLASSAAAINPSHGSRSARTDHPSFPLLLRRALATSAAGCKCGPTTPIPSWKIYDVPGLFGPKSKRRRHPDAEFGQNSDFVGAHHFRGTVSARKLAAALWELEGMSSNRSRRKEQGSSDPAPVSSRYASSCNRKQYTKASHDKQMNDRQKSVSSSKNREHDANVCRCPYLECRSGISRDLLRLLHQLCSLEEQHRLGASVIASLRRDLKESQERAQKLKAVQKSYQEDIARLKKKLAEEKSMSHLRVQEAVMMAVKPLKEELEKEKKSRHKLEAYQKKIIKEMNEAKKALIKVKKDLEREKRARELIEDVCDELAKEISDDKAKVEELKRQSAKVREEVEEERKMLQMADVWREERVHMKLAEAKHELEKKNTALDRLRNEFGAILENKNDISHVRGGSPTCNDQVTSSPLQIAEPETAGRNIVQTADCIKKSGNKGSAKGSFDEIEVSNLSFVGSLDVNRSFYPTPAFSDAGKKPIECTTLSCNGTSMENQQIRKRTDEAGPSAEWMPMNGADMPSYESVSLQRNNGARSKDGTGSSRKRAVMGKGGHHRYCKSGHDEIKGPFLMESVCEGRSSHDSSKSKYQSTAEAFSLIHLHDGGVSPSKAGPSLTASPRKEDGGDTFPSPQRSTCPHCHQDKFYPYIVHMSSSAGNNAPKEPQRGCIKDNSLRAKLLEAKLEAQQGRMKDSGYSKAETM